MLDREVNPVVEALEQGGLQVTALHNHYLDEQPRLFYVHYWGAGSPARIAGALHAALSKAAFASK